MPHRILVADDDHEIVELISLYLKNEGYEVLPAHNGDQCMQIVNAGHVDLLVLDIMMPGMDGLEVCKAVREKSNVPVIFVSAKTQPMERIMGLATGADDYMIKPFHPLELVARVKAQIRRYTMLSPGAEQEKTEITVKDLTILPEEHRVLKGDEECQLTPTEFGILLLLASHPGKVFSMEEIFERVWQEKAYQQDNTVMVHMRRIREKLNDDSKKPKYIRTVWGVGYKIET